MSAGAAGEPDSSSDSGSVSGGRGVKSKEVFSLNPVYMGSSDSSLSLSSCREDSVRTGLVGDTGEA